MSVFTDCLPQILKLNNFKNYWQSLTVKKGRVYEQDGFGMEDAEDWKVEKKRGKKK